MFPGGVTFVCKQDEDDDDTDWYHCGLCGFKNLELKVMAKHAATKHQQVQEQIFA